MTRWLSLEIYGLSEMSNNRLRLVGVFCRGWGGIVVYCFLLTYGFVPGVGDWIEAAGIPGVAAADAAGGEAGAFD